MADAKLRPPRAGLDGPVRIADEVTSAFENAKVYSRPRKISMPLYRRQEKNAHITELRCVAFVEGPGYSTFITSLRDKARKLAAKRIPAMAMSPVSNAPVKSRSRPIR